MKKVTTALVAVMSCVGAQAQSVDALLDKLVDKGILTVTEANDMREQADRDFTQAYQVKTGMPNWVNSFRIGGDFRGRYDMITASNPAFNDRHRLRYRLRFGAIASMTDNFEVGFRLTSGEPAGGFGGDPISGNTTLSDNASKKFVYVDLAYAKWSGLNTPSLNGVFTFGKMENPFVFSDLLFDGDYTPEGLAQQFSYRLAETHSLSLNMGEFALDEISGRDDDPFLLGAQLRFDSAWSHKVATSFGIAGLMITDEEQLTTTIPATGGASSSVPNVNAGNEHTGSPNPLPTPAGTATVATLANQFNPIVLDAAVTYTLESFPFYQAPFPIRLGADYLYNPGADDANQGYSVGLTLGKSGKRGLWDLSYRWRELQANAWYEELVDSDFGGYYGGNSAFNPGRGAGIAGGTNLRGHVIRAAYSPYDSLTFSATALLAEVINEVPAGNDSDVARLLIDAVWKF